jgi:GNAT superfamily N-acetyltransferase
MKITDIPASEAHRLLPLLHDVHALHVAQQPERYTAHPADADLATWLQDWLSQDNVFALGAESPQGALLGYAIWELEQRPALPVRAAETRAMLHHIAIAEAWRRMGVGKALISTLKERATEQDATVVATTYAPFNTASGALMQSMGMEPVLTMAELRV